MRLIYINEIGTDYKGQKQYEFIFSKSTELDVDSWFSIPASLSSESKTPSSEYIDLIGLLKDTNVELELVQNSDYFGVIDAVDGVVCLGWEKYDSERDRNRLIFMFGDNLDEVTKKLKQVGFHLLKQEIKFKQL